RTAESGTSIVIALKLRSFFCMCPPCAPTFVSRSLDGAAGVWTMMDTRCLPPRPMMAARSPDTLADFTVLRQPPVLFPAARARSQMMMPAHNDTASDRAIKRLRTLARRLNIALNLLRRRETGESLKRAQGNPHLRF